MKYVILIILLWRATASVAAEQAEVRESPETLQAAIGWLKTKSTEMIRASRRQMKSSIAAFPPQVGSHYDAFWLRDYAYTLEGNIEAFSDPEIKDACQLFINALREDGAGVDCVAFDGRPIYMPGYGSMGKNPVADGSQFTIDVAWRTYQRTRDAELVKKNMERLLKCLRAVPRNPETGLVFIDPKQPWDRCAYGFTDTVPKRGDELFCSLLLIQASHQLADLSAVAERRDEAAQWKTDAERVAEKVRQVFWNPHSRLFHAATVQCNQPDIWGSAFAVYLGVATQEQSLEIARYFKEHYREIVHRGQIRHLPGGMYWENLPENSRDRYQNGGYWGTPVGWFVYTLDLVDPTLADRTFVDMVQDFRTNGVNENVFAEKAWVPDYNASAALPLAGVRAMLERRKQSQN